MKILLLPQLLEYHVLHLVTFSCHPIEPVLGFLLRVARICYCPRYLYGLFLFIIVVQLGKASFATSRLVPVVLRTIAGDMPLLATDVASDVCKIRSPTSR